MKMIAVDWDDTFTSMPEAFSLFIRAATDKGNMCFFVTYRDENDVEDLKAASAELGIEIIATGGKAKRSFCLEMGIEIDIWIDDMPEIILADCQNVKLVRVA